MGKIEFKKIHTVIIDFLKEESNTELDIIGSWYCRFLESDKENFSLYLPFYSKEFTKLAFNYIRSFTVVFNLLKQERIAKFEGLCLFDIFNKSSLAIMDDLTLDFLEQKENLALWGEDTLTKLDVFLPVFNKEEILNFKTPQTIKNTFKLFKSIRDSRIIDTPRLIELEEKKLSFNNLENIDNDLISENLFLIDNNLDDDSAMQLEEDLISQELYNRIFIKYPYSKKPHPYLMDVGKKKFNLVFNNRFAYKEILENDIFLLKDETKLSTQLKYNIIDTNHSKNLYDLFKYFKEQWVGLELNKYTNPFPKYWFLFLNPSLTNDNWLKQFKKDFPAVAEKPIIKTVEKIINEVIGLKWIEGVIRDESRILFPELKSLRRKRLEFIFNNFKNYITSLNENAEFIYSVDSNNYNNVIVLDSFNIIELANKNQCNWHEYINVIVPDFLYFGYQPWIKFHLFNYQFAPLLNGSRKVLDNNFITNREKVEKLRNKIVSEIKSEFKTYKSKYKEEESIIEPDEILNIEDVEFNNVEEIEYADSGIERNNESVVINKNLENELTISYSEKVLLQKDTLLYVKAGSLKKGDLIIRNIDITELYKSNALYDKFVNIPQDVLKYQNELFRNSNIYETLKNQGISYQHQGYFDSNYVLKEEDESVFRIPRRKKDWSIICEFLNISHSNQQLAFIAYYGRSKQNDLKLMYKSIIELLLENNWIGTIEDPTITTSVSEIVNKYNYIFNTTNTNEIAEISESIISTILNQLTFTEIQKIKTIVNE